MPLSVHASTPAQVDAATSAASITTASFTPPAGALLVAAVCIDAGGAPAPTLSVSNSGTALTWTKVAEQVTGEQVGAALFVGQGATGAALTVTFTTSNTDNKSLKVWVVTGHDPADPVGDVTAGVTNVNTLVIPGLVASASNSLGMFAAAQDESSTTTPTSPESVFDPVLMSGQVAGGSGHKPMGAVGAQTTYTIDAAGTTTCTWHYVGVEILVLATTVTVGTGIASAEAFGTPTITVGGVIAPTGIASAEAFGTPTLVAGPVTVSPAGIGSAEAFGTARLQLSVAPTGIDSAEAFGTPSVVLVVKPTGIPSAEAFGATTLRYLQDITVTAGIASAEAFGTPELQVTLDARLRVIQPPVRIVPLYELLVVARIPSEAGPPSFLEVDGLEWTSLSWSTTLSRPQGLSATCPVSSITEPVAQRLRAPDRLPTELWLFRNGRQVFAGPLMGGARQGNELSLEASGLLAYLQWMIVLSDLRFDQVDQFTMAATLIDQWQATPYGHFGIGTSAVGTSGRLRDESYARSEIHQVSRRVEELGARRDGFDAEIDPTTRQLQLWYPGKGTDRSAGEDAIVFDARNVDAQDAMFSIAPGDFASDAFGSGSSTGADVALWSEQSNTELRAAFGRTAITGSWSDVSEQTTLDDHVAALRDARDQPLRAPGRRVRVTPDSDLNSYDVGDTVLYEIDSFLRIGGAYRIRSRSVSIAETGQESVDLEFV